MTDLHISFEHPLGEKEVRKRDLPTGISRLVVGLPHRNSSAETVRRRLAGVIELWRRPSETMYALAFNLFMSESRIRDVLKAHRVLQVPSGDWALECRSDADLHLAFSDFEAEEWAVLLADSRAQAADALAAALTYSGPASSFNALFSGVFGRAGLVVFYAANHRSLEVLGDLSTVYVRCLRRLLPL